MGGFQSGFLRSASEISNAHKRDVLDNRLRLTWLTAGLIRADLMVLCRSSTLKLDTPILLLDTHQIQDPGLRKHLPQWMTRTYLVRPCSLTLSISLQYHSHVCSSSYIRAGSCTRYRSTDATPSCQTGKRQCHVAIETAASTHLCQASSDGGLDLSAVRKHAPLGAYIQLTSAQSCLPNGLAHATFVSVNCADQSEYQCSYPQTAHRVATYTQQYR